MKTRCGSPQSLLSGASLVQVGGVRVACCAFLARALCAENALGIRAFAELHACAELAAAAARYLHAHFLQVLDAEEFLALAPDTLARLLDSDRITVSAGLSRRLYSTQSAYSNYTFLSQVPSEEVILDAVIRWMQHDAEVRLSCSHSECGQS